jgi:cystathionine beta-lyase/cystathionine gamma-synthase
MAACTTVIQALCRAGAHLVMPDNVYGGTWDLVHDVYQRWGLAYTAVDMGDLDAVAAPQEAWLVQRGIKTLPVRMRQICASSQRIAELIADLDQALAD